MSTAGARGLGAGNDVPRHNERNDTKKRRPRVNPSTRGRVRYEAIPRDAKDPKQLSEWFERVGVRLVPRGIHGTLSQRQLEVLALWAVRAPNQMLMPFLRQYSIPVSTWYTWTADADFRRVLDDVNGKRATAVLDVFHEELGLVVRAQLTNAKLAGDPVSNAAAQNIFKVMGLLRDRVEFEEKARPEEQDPEVLRKRLEELDRIEAEYGGNERKGTK